MWHSLDAQSTYCMYTLPTGSILFGFSCCCSHVLLCYMLHYRTRTEHAHVALSRMLQTGTYVQHNLKWNCLALSSAAVCTRECAVLRYTQAAMSSPSAVAVSSSTVLLGPPAPTVCIENTRTLWKQPFAQCCGVNTYCMFVCVRVIQWVICFAVPVPLFPRPSRQTHASPTPSMILRYISFSWGPEAQVFSHLVVGTRWEPARVVE